MSSVATFAGGCFWCTEALIKQVEGVEDVVVGYTGGHIEKPTYEQVSDHSTGHAEAAQIHFDPAKISYSKLLDVFFMTHDPTTLNRQGADVGPQYRSAIFYHDEEQKKLAEEKIKEIDESGKYDDPVVTEVNKFKEFFPAEDYHQAFYENNPDHPYSQAVIKPKLEKLKKIQDKK